MAFNRTFNAEEKARLKRIVEEGIQVESEINILKEGLSETVKAIAEEMDISAATLKKAIKVASKASFGKETDKFDELETILEAVGKTV